MIVDRVFTPGLAQVAYLVALVVDARAPETFTRAHLAGSFFAGADPDFVNWVGWLAPYDRELILVLDDADRYDGVLTELRRIGLDAVAGYVAGGMDAWQPARLPMEAA